LIDYDDDHRRRVGRLRGDRHRDEGKERNQKQSQGESILVYHFNYLSF